MERNLETTCRYYSKWLGQDEILLRDFRGIKYLYSEKRNSIPFGYGTPFDLYVFCQKERMIISYGDKGREQAGILTDKIKKDMSATEVKLVLERIFGQKADHNVKYVFAGSDSMPVSEAMVLVEEDYGKYESFWRKCHPECQDTVWLKDYFNEMVQEHMCIGVFVDDILVSCTDAPGMPYMENEVQEIGINTLPEYRKQGFAAAACQKCLREILCHGKVPQWSSAMGNQVSRKLAEKVGFVEFGEVVSMTI